MTMTHIETIELGSSAASITFSSIPQDYTDLLLLVSPRTDDVDARDNVLVQPNNSSSNLSTIVLDGYDSGNVATASLTEVRLLATSATATSNTFGSNSVYFSNYTSSAAKSMSIEAVQENNSSASYALGIQAGLWNDTTAITSIVLLPRTGSNLLANTTASLFGIS